LRISPRKDSRLYTDNEGFNFVVDFFRELVQMAFDLIEHLMKICWSSRMEGILEEIKFIFKEFKLILSIDE